jgi:GNAT superfamily N-acetyltransferase
VLVRALAPGDVPAVAQLFGDAGLAAHHLVSIISRRIGAPDAIDLGAFDNEHLVGALVATNIGTHVFLSHFAVHSSHRRTGIGRRLHDRLVAEGEKHGCKGIITDSWLTATPFYFDLGYRLPGSVFLVRDLGGETKRD